MKKLLISILIVLLLLICIFTVTRGIKIGGINILGVPEIKNKSENLDEEIQKATKLASSDYPKIIDEMQTNIKSLKEQKKNYEDVVTVSTDEQVQTASQFQKYEIEYLWTTVGNHATSEGVVIKMDLIKTSIENNYNLNFTVNGSYIGITDFISDIENDSVLGFKIEEFNMVPNNESSDLKATFVCKDITIKDISQSPVKNTDKTNENEQNNNNTTNNNTTNTNTTNTNATNTNTNNTTSNVNNTNTAN